LGTVCAEVSLPHPGITVKNGRKRLKTRLKPATESREEQDPLFFIKQGITGIIAREALPPHYSLVLSLFAHSSHPVSHRFTLKREQKRL